jgi:hypothetical protein
MKVQFVPFHTPQADSFCHNCPITSSRASARFSSSFSADDGGGWVGVREGDRLSSRLWRLRGDLDGEVMGE